MTSHLDIFLAGKYSHAGYLAAVQSDWQQGEPLEVGNDGNGMGAVDGHRWIGYVGTTAAGRPLHDFRAVATDNPRRRRVFAVDSEGRAFYVGMLARRTRFARTPATALRQPHPRQKAIDTESAALLIDTKPLGGSR
jgi:hypothetical protein